jgi:hypothetical protein
MRLLDVDREEARAVRVLRGDLLDPLDRAAERRSREAAEDEDERLPADVGGEMILASPDLLEHDVGRDVADVQLPLAALVVAQHPDDVPRPDLPGEDAARDEDEQGETEEDAAELHVLGS